MTATTTRKPVSRTIIEEPVTSLYGVGPRVAESLSRLGISRIADLLFHLPQRYEDRTRVIAIGELVGGQRAVIEGEIELAQTVFRGRRMLLVHLSDGTGSILLRFFHFTKRQSEQLVRGVRMRCFGEVRAGRNGLEIVHPEYRVFGPGVAVPVEDRLTPVYPMTEGLKQGRLRNLIGQALNRLNHQGLPELISSLETPGLPGLESSIRLLHNPPADMSLEAFSSGRHPAQRRLAFEELLAHHLSLKKLRENLRRELAVPLNPESLLCERFIDSLPFDLTAAQSRVLEEISADLAKDSPMMRLVQGDVGSGKTVVAAIAALMAVDAGCQAAVMAPTELLAEQHAKNFRAWLEPLGLTVATLSGKQRAAERRAALAAIADGSACCVVGTHALFQESVDFHRLAFLVVDEQHRFGVHQRLALRKKGMHDGRVPHQLVMTATPIPRTLAMTAYADLDVSAIDELPPGRKPVTTLAVSQQRRPEVLARVERADAKGHQVYWVCPLIEESDVLEAQAAEETTAMLREALPDVGVGLVHGRMKPVAKERAMRAFMEGKTTVLVATTVIEVGVDVPNASLMIIENSERMGLAQLHQLRGRVGRGSAESVCVLMYKPALSQNARERLRVLKETADGFEVARKDLELRGPGEVLGTRQTGVLQMRVADLLRDADLIPQIQRVATDLMRNDPAAVTALIKRWIGGRTELGKV